MRIRIFTTSLFVGALILPFSFAQAALSIEARVELAALASQLVQVMTQISAAVAQGPTYTNSPAFQPIANAIASQIAVIQTSVVRILSSSVVSQTPAPIPYGASCPRLTRALIFGMQGTDILLVQQFLARDSAAHFSGAISGVFDSETLSAVQRFQAAYGIVSYGTFDTTGYGRIGPRTTEVLSSVCSGSGAPYPVVPLLSPLPIAGVSSGSLAVSSKDQPQTTVVFTLTGFPNSGCQATNFTLDFGDGQKQAVSFGASCHNQEQKIPHRYATAGSYTASLKSGTFQLSLAVAVVASNYSISLNSSAGTISNAVSLKLVFNPGNRCDAMTYLVRWGDGTDQPVTFSGEPCASETRTLTHTYSSPGSYTIQAVDNNAKVTSLNFSAVQILSAGAGDPFMVLDIPADGTNQSTAITDASIVHRALSVVGGARIDTAAFVSGASSLRLPGGGYVSTPASADFNYGSGPFTIDLWFNAEVFPAATQQASILQQADSSASDSSLGGAGLMLYGSKLYFVGKIGSVRYHPYYNNSIHSGDLTAGVWYHAAIVRSGSIVYMFLNGVLQDKLSISGSANESTSSLALGRYGEYSGNYFRGWVDEVQIAKGIARWTSDFDPFVHYGLDDGSTVSGSAVASGARQAKITVTRTPGSVCVGGSYTVNYGDGTSGTIEFTASCDAATKIFTHLYSVAGTYTITVSKASSSVTFTVYVSDAVTGGSDSTPGSTPTCCSSDGNSNN